MFNLCAAGIFVEHLWPLLSSGGTSIAVRNLLQLNASSKCNDCSGKTNPFCFGSTANHQWDHRSANSFPLCYVGQESAQMPCTDFMPWSMPTHIPSYSGGNNATPVPRRSVPTVPNDSSLNTFSVWPVIHHGITCDSCKNTIEGIRHNCLECPG